MVSKSGFVDLIEEDVEERGGLVVWIGPEFRIDLDDECGGHGRKQTGLMSLSACVNNTIGGTHKDERGVQILVIFFEELFVILLGHLAVFPVELVLKVVLGSRILAAWGLSKGLVACRRNSPVSLLLSILLTPILHPSFFGLAVACIRYWG